MNVPGVDVVEEYNGHVDPGGAATRRVLDALTITKVSVGPMDNNAYLLVCRATNEALLVDAANEPERISDLVGHDRQRPDLRTIVTTHQHQDHWQALGAVAGQYGANTIAHAADAGPLPVPPDRLVAHGDTIPVGECELEVIHLRGHTPGSIALLYREPGGRPHLFTGDCLFPGGVGEHVDAGGVHVVVRGRQGARLRRAAGRHLVLPGPRRRLDARRATPEPRRMARTRLVTPIRVAQRSPRPSS